MRSIVRQTSLTPAILSAEVLRMAVAVLLARRVDGLTPQIEVLKRDVSFGHSVSLISPIYDSIRGTPRGRDKNCRLPGEPRCSL